MFVIFKSKVSPSILDSVRHVARRRGGQEGGQQNGGGGGGEDQAKAGVEQGHSLWEHELIGFLLGLK